MRVAEKKITVNYPKRRVGRPSRHASLQEVRDLHLQGLSFRAIALRTGLGYGTVRRVYHQMGAHAISA